MSLTWHPSLRDRAARLVLGINLLVINTSNRWWLLLAQRASHSFTMHYRKTLICRVSRPLPSARLRALGKDVVCRVPGHGHSAKNWHTACPGFTECRPSAKQGTLQSVSIAECCPVRGADGVKSLSSATFWHSAKETCCRVPPAGTRQRRNFAECAGLALGKVSFAECWNLGTRQN